VSVPAAGEAAHGASSVKRADAVALRWHFDWRVVVLGLLIALLVYQVVVPFAMIAWTSLKTARPGDPAFFDLSFTLANYVRAFGSYAFWSVTWNTLYFSLASTLLAFVLGTFLAWVVERTNTPIARLIGFILIARIVIPGVLITISWILIASPRIGILNYVMFWLTGNRAFFNVYSMWGMVWVHALEMVPLAYLLMSAAFQAMDPRLEEASAMTGAGTWRTLRRITLPLALPAVGAAILLLFITTIETFEVPLLMGGRAGVRVFASEIFLTTARTPVDWGIASTYSMALVLMSVVLLFVYFRLLRHGERYQTVTGKDFKPRRVDLGPWRWPTAAIAILLVLMITGVPLLVMIYASLLPFWQPPTLAAFQSMTLNNYALLLADESSIRPMINSTLLGIGSATVVVLVCAVISYVVHKTRIPGRSVLDTLAFAPIAIPSVVLGATFLWFYLLVPLPVLGTLTIIGLAYLTKYLPIALRFVSTSMAQIHNELDEAAQVAGVGWARNFVKVILPLLRPGLLAAWFWVMVHAFRELTVALMLARSQNRTAAVLVLDLWEQGSFMALSAFGVIMFAILMLLVVMSHRLGQRFGVREV
jgi:iron(III) transport system permease protein